MGDRLEVRYRDRLVGPEEGGEADLRWGEEEVRVRHGRDGVDDVFGEHVHRRYPVVELLDRLDRLGTPVSASERLLHQPLSKSDEGRVYRRC